MSARIEDARGHSKATLNVQRTDSGTMSHIESYITLLRILWTTRTWILLGLIFLQLVGQLLLLPILPSLVTNDFASRREGKPMHCDDYEPKDSPVSCRDAHADVVLFSTVSGFFQNTVFAIVLSPALGAWSDIHGRKPVLILAQSISILPVCIVILNMNGILPLYWMYVVQACTGAVTLIAPSLAYMADLIPPAERAAAFGLILASFSVAILVGPPIGAALSPGVVPWATIGIILCTVVATILFLPESVQREDSIRAHEAAQRDSSRMVDSSGFLNATRRAIAILKRNALFVKLTLILMFTSMVGEGLQDILIQYLQLKMGFKAKDVSQMFMVLGLGALLVQGVLLQFFLSLLGEARLLGMGLVLSTCQQLMLTVSTQKWHALGAVFIGSFSSVTFPTISSIKANNSEEHEQGSVQGALYGARSIASGMGPLAFAYLFKVFTQSDSSLPFFPGAPFVLGTLVMAATTVLACTLPADAGGHGGTLFGGDSRSVPKRVDEGAIDPHEIEEQVQLLHT